MTISKELLDELLKGCERPEDLLGDAGLMKELKIKLMERMLGAELTAHLGYEEGKDFSGAEVPLCRLSIVPNYVLALGIHVAQAHLSPQVPLFSKQPPLLKRPSVIAGRVGFLAALEILRKHRARAG